MERRKLPKVIWPSLDEISDQVVAPKTRFNPAVVSDLPFDRLTAEQQADAIIYEARRVMWQRPVGSGQVLLSGEAMSDGQLNRFNLSLGIITPDSFRDAFELSEDELVRLSRNVSAGNSSQYYGDPALVIEATSNPDAAPGGFELNKESLSSLTADQRASLMNVVDVIMSETIAFSQGRSA